MAIQNDAVSEGERAKVLLEGSARCPETVIGVSAPFMRSNPEAHFQRYKEGRRNELLELVSMDLCEPF